jgi:nucleoside-diphosphate-sugar epimerase
MVKVCVTGASGKVGQATVAELREHGYRVTGVDLHAVTSMTGVAVTGADLRDAGDALQALHGADAVVHLANIPAPGFYPPARTFNDNMAMNFNVFHAATQLGHQRVVWASSETTLGLPFATPPRYMPVDEDHYPLPTSSYALSKVATETIAEQMAGWSQIPFVALRFSNVFKPDDYALMSQWQDDPRKRMWNLWGYVDARDAAAACRLALEADDLTGAQAFIVAAADTVMETPSAQLAHEVFPGVELSGLKSEHETLLSIDKARELLGFEPQYSWRE